MKKGKSLWSHVNREHESKDRHVQNVALRYFLYDEKPYSRSAEAFPLYLLSNTTAVEPKTTLNATASAGSTLDTFPTTGVPTIPVSVRPGLPPVPASATPLKSIRGINLYPRVLGQAIISGAFKSSFSASSLDAASLPTIDGQDVSELIAGPPDAEGTVLIGLVQNSQDGKIGEYSLDAEEFLPRTFALGKISGDRLGDIGGVAISGL